MTGRQGALFFAWALVSAYLIFIAWQYIAGYADAADGGVPLFTDFTPTYGGALLLQDLGAEALYDQDLLAPYNAEAAQAAYGHGLSPVQAHLVGNPPWLYPPIFNFYITPLAWLPYLLALAAWILLTAVPYLAAIGSILPWRIAAPLALAAPPAFYNLMYGQTGFLSAGLIALGLCHLRHQPILAGMLIGLAAFKPHLGLLVPFALLAGGYWKTFASAALTVAASVAASLAVHGPEPWIAVAGDAQRILDGFASTYNFRPMTTVLATLAMAGVPLHAAWMAQGLSTLVAAGLVTACWAAGRSRPDLLGLQAAILCYATPLAIPMAYLYDLCLLVPGAAWCWQHMQRHGAHAVEWSLLTVTLAAILAVKPVAEAWGFQPGAGLVLLLLGHATWRYRRALGRPGTAAP